MDAKDLIRENRKRKNSSKNTSKLSQLLVTISGLANCLLANKADKAAAADVAAAAAADVAAAAAAKKKKRKRTR